MFYGENALDDRDEQEPPNHCEVSHSEIAPLKLGQLFADHCHMQNLYTYDEAA